MLNLENRLFVFHDDDSTFINHTNAAQDYARDDFSVALDSANDFLYVGFRKPINSIYVELKTPNTNANTFTFEYFNGTDFVDIPTFSDETKGFIRSGFLIWERNLTDEASTTINSQEAFFYRLQPSVTHSATEIQGLNIVFSDDSDLKLEVNNIDDFLPSGASSHILSHVGARDKLIMDLRLKGYIKRNRNSGRFKDLNVFDILNIQQLRDSSKWQALSNIFDDLSDRSDDKWAQKAAKFSSRYKSVRDQIQFLGIDADDDGLADINEEQASSTTRFQRR